MFVNWKELLLKNNCWGLIEFMKKNIALILASGTGSRSGLDIPKQFYEIAGKTLLEYSISVFKNHPLIDEIVVVSHPDYIEQTKSLVGEHLVVVGGESRQESSYNGVFVLSCLDDDNVLIHDAVRAFITPEIISNCIEGLNKHQAVCVATDTADTVLEVDNNGKIIAVPERKKLRLAQTPQCFKFGLIKKAHKLAKEQNITVTDDCGLILANNLAEIYVVEGSSRNKKITYPEDLKFAQWLVEND